MSITAVMNVDRTTLIAGETLDINFVGTSSSATSKPFHHLFYLIDWGDPGNLDNISYGPVVSHVYRDPGTYTVNARIFHINGDEKNVSSVITIQDPDTVYSGTNTISIANTGSDHVGAATGSNQQTADTWAAVLAFVARGKRVELRAGDTFTTVNGESLDLSSGTGVALIGKFGSGADPVIDFTGTPSGAANALTIANTGYLALRDIRFIYTGAAHTQALAPINSDHRVDYVSITDIVSDGFSTGVGCSASGPEFYSEADHEHVGIHRWSNLNVNISGGWIVIFCGGNHFSYVGCDLGIADESLLRFTNGNYLCIDGNIFGSSGASQHQLKAHARAYAADPANISKYWNIFANVFNSTSAPWKVAIGPQNGVSDERVEDVVIDGNYHDCSTSDIGDVIFGVLDCTIRNEKFDGKASVNYVTGCFSGQRGIEPLPTGHEVYGCSLYNSGASFEAKIHSRGTYGAGNPIIKGCIVDAASSSSAIISDGVFVGGGNYIGNALFTAPASQDFSLQAGSSARNAGDNTAPFMSSSNGHLRKISPLVPDSGAEEDNVAYPDISGGGGGGVGMGIAITTGYDANWQNYQRNIFTKKVFDPVQVSLDLSGSSAVAGLLIQGKITEDGNPSAVIVDWKDLGITSGAATEVVEFSDIPQGGWYSWSFRVVDAVGAVVDSVTSTNKFGVGDVFLITGQSNGEQMFTVSSSPTVNAKTSVFHGTAWGPPTANGSATFTDHMQQALTNGGEDIPVSAINLSLGGSSTLAVADYVMVGHWEKNGPRPIFDIFQQLGVRALKYHLYATSPATNFQTPCRGVVYWQGEAEASETVVSFLFIETAQFITGLIEVFGNFIRWMPTQTSKNTIQVQIGRLQQNSTTEVPDGMNTAVGMTREAHRLITHHFPETLSALCETMGISKALDGVHHTASQQEEAGNNIAYACRKAFDIQPDTTFGSFTRKPGTHGPIIESAEWTSRDKLLVTVKHESGTDLTVPSTAHECFQLINANGKAYFSDISKINSTSFELTLGSDIDSGGEVGFAYCNDSMPEISSLITDDEGYHLHPTYGQQGDRVHAMPLLTENIMAGDDSTCSAVGTLSTCVVAVGDGAKIEPGDTIYVSDRVGIVSRGYRRVASIAGDTVTVTKNFASIPQAGDICRYSNTTNPPFKHGRRANASMAINNPKGVSTGIRGTVTQ